MGGAGKLLDFVTIEKIAAKAAETQVANPGLERVVAKPTTDSEGRDALRITLVLRPEAVEALSGDAALDLLVTLQNDLQSEGEERLAIVEYATETEMKEEEEDTLEGERQDAELEGDEG
ncbi:MAG: hypothetical protein QOJ91_3098 [Sphingomonadales bacterium]|jgi:hypothetical protein|nr:hypothetical protein [Sphingomonadales bacterium]